MPDERPEQEGLKPTNLNLETRKRELTEILRASPLQCPACGGTNILKIERLTFSVSGERRCERCGCVWSPGWNKAWAVVACLVAFPLGVTCLCGFPWLVKTLIAGEYEYCLRWYNSWLPRFTWPYLDLLIMLFGVFLFLGFTWRGVRVLLGRAGRPRVLDVGAQQLASVSQPVAPEARAEGQRKKPGALVMAVRWVMGTTKLRARPMAVRWVLGILVLWAVFVSIAMWRFQCESEGKLKAMRAGKYDEIITSSDSPDRRHRCVVIRRPTAHAGVLFFLRIEDRETGQTLEGQPLTIGVEPLRLEAEMLVRKLRRATFRWTNGKVVVDSGRAGRPRTVWLATIRDGAQHWRSTFMWEDKPQRTPASTTQSAGDS